MAGLYGSNHGRGVANPDVPLGAHWLPTGACSYQDITQGETAPVCGCKRFWLNGKSTLGHDGDKAWCFCGHHACFHDITVHAAAPVASTIMHGRGDNLGANLMPGANVLPPWASRMMQTSPSPHQRLDPPVALEATIDPSTALGLGINNTTASHSIDTRLWHALNAFAREQDGGHFAGNQALPSTAVPSLIDEPRASPSRVTLGRPQQQRRPMMAPPVNIPHSHANDFAQEEYSATEVATPSTAGTPDFRATAARPVATSASPAQLPPGLPPSIEHRPRGSIEPATTRPTTQPIANDDAPRSSMSLPEIATALQQQSRRIAALETLSFSHSTTDDLHDKFDVMDARLLDLEHWRQERDKAREDEDAESDVQANNNEHRRLPFEVESFPSNLSDTDAAAQTEAVVLATLAANAETHPRIDALEARIESLESGAPPSHHRPWHVQVVWLPFGRQLPGIWFSPSESTQQTLYSATRRTEEWSPVQSEPRLSFHSAPGAAWTTESIEAWANETEEEWLSPKACGPSTTAFQRLASRGFVRSIFLTSADAAHICNEIAQAFTSLPQQGAPLTGMSDKYLGLQEKLIPLRKVRKSSRLRFLSQAEMATPTTWTAPFLDSSVFMKVNESQRRLYVSTAHAYQQPAETGWTWQALKRLPAYDTDGEVQAAQASGRIIERCWTYHDRLDRAASFNEFLTSQDLWSTRSQSPSDEAASISAADVQPAHIRSLSLPSSASRADAPRQKRRVTSLDAPTIDTTISSPTLLAKRRRMSASLDLYRSGINFTPRWSHEPPTPFTSVPADGNSGMRNEGQSNAKRGITPQAYATPHSNSYSQSHDDRDGGGGDTEMDSIKSAKRSDFADESDWEGVQDGTETQPLAAESSGHWAPACTSDDRVSMT